MNDRTHTSGPHKANADVAIKWAGASAVMVVAAIAAYISYRHAYELAVTHGEAESTARLWPLTVDGTIFAASLVILQSARRGIKGWGELWLAYVMLAAGIAATIAANVAHGLDSGPVGAAVAALPALALVGSYELLMWIVRMSPRVAESAPADAAPCQCGETGEPVALDLPEALARVFESGVSQRQIADALGADRKKLSATIRQARAAGQAVAQIHPTEVPESA